MLYFQNTGRQLRLGNEIGTAKGLLVTLKSETSAAPFISRVNGFPRVDHTSVTELLGAGSAVAGLEGMSPPAQ